mmetsp:Transcript_15905/g.39355  ORF Transcript_15905/g.39355 Transcript_15905/m.39355 type:complete len:239 (+) Transcript_15905:425-1141(+)
MDALRVPEPELRTRSALQAAELPVPEQKQPRHHDGGHRVLPGERHHDCHRRPYLRGVRCPDQHPGQLQLHDAAAGRLQPALGRHLHRRHHAASHNLPARLRQRLHALRQLRVQGRDLGSAHGADLYRGWRGRGDAGGSRFGAELLAACFCSRIGGRDEVAKRDYGKHQERSCGTSHDRWRVGFDCGQRGSDQRHFLSAAAARCRGPCRGRERCMARRTFRVVRGVDVRRHWQPPRTRC